MVKTNIPKVLKVEMIWILWYISALTADTLNLFLLLLKKKIMISMKIVIVMEWLSLFVRREKKTR